VSAALWRFRSGGVLVINTSAACRSPPPLRAPRLSFSPLPRQHARFRLVNSKPPGRTPQQVLRVGASLQRKRYVSHVRPLSRYDVMGYFLQQPEAAAADNVLLTFLSDSTRRQQLYTPVCCCYVIRSSDEVVFASYFISTTKQNT